MKDRIILDSQGFPKVPDSIYPLPTKKMAAYPGHSEVPSFEKIFVNMELVFKDSLSNIEHVFKN